MDDDLDQMSHEELLVAARRMRAGIRAHRDRSGHELCWHHPDLWALLPDAAPPDLLVPEWPQFMRGCVRYRASLDQQLPDVRRTTAELGE